MILIIDDDRAIRVSLTLLLERNGYEVMQAEGPKAAMDVVRSNSSLQLCLMDMNFSLATDGEEGLTLLRQVKVFRPDVPVILMTAWGSIDLAVRGMRHGAFDFITKPWNNHTLMERVETALELSPHKTPQTPQTPLLFPPSLRSPIAPISQLPPRGDDTIRTVSPSLGGVRGGQEGGSSFIVGSLSPILSTLDRVAPTMAPILITGESGTGKEVIAQYIHEHSQRAAGPLVKVNLGGISASLFESEMFGHKAGAFTDAREDRRGRFEMAEGGTIFLDEIGELDLACQVKLLRVLQDHTYEVLGDSTTRRADVRVVCATNADLPAMIAAHTFREDLYYRINLVSIHLPALRERKDDIPLLVRHFIANAPSAPSTPRWEPTDDDMHWLQSLPLTGNIRELKNIVERAVLMGRLEKGPLLTSPKGEELHPASATPQTLEAIERDTIADAINRHGGNLTLVARELGISRGALYRKIDKHGL